MSQDDRNERIVEKISEDLVDVAESLSMEKKEPGREMKLSEMVAQVETKYGAALANLDKLQKIIDREIEARERSGLGGAGASENSV